MKKLFVFLAIVLAPLSAMADKTIQNVGTDSITVQQVGTNTNITIASGQTVTLDDATADFLLSLKIPASRGSGSIEFVLVP